jgi:hypothetical protein
MHPYKLINPDGSTIKNFVSNVPLSDGVHNMRPAGGLAYNLLDAGAKTVHQFTSNVVLTEGPVLLKAGV